MADPARRELLPLAQIAETLDRHAVHLEDISAGMKAPANSPVGQASFYRALADLAAHLAERAHG